MPVTTTRPFEDGVSEPTSTPGGDSQTASDQDIDQLEPAGPGPLLELSNGREVAEKVRKMWDEKDPEMAEREARWKANAKRRAGVIGVHVIKTNPDKHEYRVWAPPGATKVPPTFNQAARLCRRLVSHLLVDPPVPECTPGGASDTGDPDKAEYATRILQDVGAGARFNIVQLGRRALSKAMTFDSGFLRIYVDPKGGGHRPRSVTASPQATTEADAVWVDGDREAGLPQPQPYVTRYVKPDGTLTDVQAEADLTWLPGLRGEVLTGKNVRFLGNATSIEDANGVLVSCYLELGKLRGQYPDLAKLSSEQLWELVKHRPAKTEALMPSHLRSRGKNGAEDEAPPDDSMILVTALYVSGPTGDYPKGAYICVAGSTFTLHRQTWAVVLENGTEELLEIPISQFAGFDEGTDDPYKYGLMHFLGPGNEIRAAVIGNAIEHLDRFNRRKVFYSPSSLFQPKIAPAAMGMYVPVEQGTEPRHEQVPDYPRVAMELLDKATEEMSDESGLLPAAQGHTDPSVQSGLHAQRIVEQVAVGLSDIRQNTEDAFVRSWRIMLQLIRAYYSSSHRISFRGDDQAYKEREWSSTELQDTRDVRILKGSFTMLAPSAKMAVAEYMYSLELIDKAQLKMLAGGNVGGTLGLQDAPELLRVRRQIDRYMEGPPAKPEEEAPDPASEMMAPPAPPVDPMAAAVDPSMAGAIAPDPAMLAQMEAEAETARIQPILASIFAPLPNDKDPAIAELRYREISRALCRTKHEAFPPAWRAGLETEYENARYYAGMGTVDDQAAQEQAGGGGAPGGAPAEDPGFDPTNPAGSATSLPPQPSSNLTPETAGGSPLSAGQESQVA